MTYDFAESDRAEARRLRERCDHADPITTDTRNHGDTLQERFWIRTDKRGPDECWEWSGGRQSREGYGVLRMGRYGKRSFYAHRVSWELHFGPIPAGLFVLHRCDNPPCVNPQHLFLGTAADNLHDAIRKGRFIPGAGGRPRGEDHKRSRLTEDAVHGIRRDREAGLSYSELAAKYGVGKTTIGHVVVGDTWRHIEEEAAVSHDESHDPTVDHVECFVCQEALRRALNKMADLDLGPRDAEVLLQTIREMAKS